MLRLFEGYGIELEYMIVDRDTLDIMPVSDEILRSIAGRYTNDAREDSMGLSNEFVRHVLEIRNIAPVPRVSPLAAEFRSVVARVNTILDPMNGVLLPSSMHPWMDPRKQTFLWHRRNRRIYETYDRIFNCRAHGWANIQSMQVNMPFCGDDEFRRLHTAVRLVLPIIPALAASSPIVLGRANGIIDNRITFYRKNQRRVPSVMGMLIPEVVGSRDEYEERILSRMYRDITPHDPEGILQREWLNSRAAIPRFDRNAIEVRIADSQECPSADIAVAEAVIAATRDLVHERWSTRAQQEAWKTGRLVSILTGTARYGEDAVIGEGEYLKMFGIRKRMAKAGDVWHHIASGASGSHACTAMESGGALDIIFQQGTLSRRILRSAGRAPSRESIRRTYEALSRCLSGDRMFLG